MTVEPTTSRTRILWWGFTRRCPRCGSAKLFHGWFRIEPRCPRCGLVFEREPGYWIGAMAINIAVTTGVLAVVFAASIALTLPDVPVGVLLTIFVPLGLLMPIAFYPFSKTVWMAVDRSVLQRLDRREQADEQVRGI